MPFQVKRASLPRARSKQATHTCNRSLTSLNRDDHFPWLTSLSLVASGIPFSKSVVVVQTKKNPTSQCWIFNLFIVKSTVARKTAAMWTNLEICQHTNVMCSPCVVQLLWSERGSRCYPVASALFWSGPFASATMFASGARCLQRVKLILTIGLLEVWIRYHLDTRSAAMFRAKAWVGLTISTFERVALLMSRAEITAAAFATVIPNCC